MSSPLIAIIPLLILFYVFVIHPLYLCPKSCIPGPKIYALTKWRLAYDDWRGVRTRIIHQLHQKYGPVVRIGPNEIHCNSLTALRTIYGAGSGFERTSFYQMFDVYGTKNLFSFDSSKQHAERKKLLANAYSKSTMLRSHWTRMVEGKVKHYLDYLSQQNGLSDEIFTSLHYFSLDAITSFLYGSKTGGTSAMTGNIAHRKLLIDILDPARRRLSWFVVHMPRLTKWLYTRTNWTESLIRPLLPMQKPATYTQIRQHGLKAWNAFKVAAENGDMEVLDHQSIMSLLWKHHISQKSGGLQDMDIASECADHLLAGIDTTADTLMFLIWALSLPAHSSYQSKLIQEVTSLKASSLNDDGVPTVEVADTLMYVDAVIKETLRLYAPLPTTEPRLLRTSVTIDGYLIPGDTVVGMSPFSLHRNEEIFPDPLRFDPGRWLGPEARVREMNKWFWAFSSGARMCIGMHLAMAEMTTLVAAIYRKYTTSIASPSKDSSPAITARFEMFFDDMAKNIKEHECHILFAEH